jgi:hypothetical protein
MGGGETKAEKRKIKIEIAGSKGCCDDDLSPDLREEILKTVGEALSGRENVVMTRLNDEALERIDALVEIELFKSRSEAAAFFIAEGMNSRGDLFERVMPTMEKIRQLKEELKLSLK